METNRYVRQKLSTSPEHLTNFIPVMRTEINAFMGIPVNIIMGIAKLPQEALYWSSDHYFGNHGIRKVMSENRFEEINTYLHFNDSSVEPARGTPGFDRLYKIKPIFNTILGNCQTKFKPTKNLSVDEHMIGFRGRLSFRQYMPAKPTKYGIKVWMAANSSNGYVLNFAVYLGKEVDGRWRIYGLG